MEYKIYKYVFEMNDHFSIVMPKGSQILKIGKQPGHKRGVYCIWALVDSDGIPVERRFRTFGTGHDIGSLLGPPALHYIDSIIDDLYVWHFFEVL